MDLKKKLAAPLPCQGKSLFHLTSLNTSMRMISMIRDLSDFANTDGSKRSQYTTYTEKLSIATVFTHVFSITNFPPWHTHQNIINIFQ